MLLPVLALANLGFAVLIRRRFGLFSGVYDVLVGLTTAVMQYSSLGIPTGLTKLLPDVGKADGLSGLARFLWRAAIIRFLVLGLCLLALQLFSSQIVAGFQLSGDGARYLQVVAGLILGRAIVEFSSKVLSTFFAQLWTNGLAVLNAVLDIGLAGLALFLGYGMLGVLSALAMSAAVVAAASIGCVIVCIGRVDPRSLVDGDTRAVPSDGVFAERVRFIVFTYVFELSLMFVGMGFAAPALAVVLGPEDVALFAIAFRLSVMSVALVVSGFRGLYRPLFSRLRLRDDPGPLRQAFTVVAKSQVLLLIPAGVGLIVMSGDYIPLLFGTEFLPAVPIAGVLVAFMYAETALNLPIIILSVDEQYRAVFVSQSIMVLLAPVFLLAASLGGLIAAGTVFGSARLASALCAYAYCRHRYRLRFPWAFAGRVAGISLPMGALLAVARMFLVTSVSGALTLTVLGVLLFGIGVRVTRLITDEEAGVIRRSSLPGHDAMLTLLAPHVATGSDD